MRISDWSSDVCSSDLFPGKGAVEIDDVQVRRARIGEEPRLRRGIVAIDSRARHIAFSKPHHLPALEVDRGEDGQGRTDRNIARVTRRTVGKRGGVGTSVSGRVEHGCSGIDKKQNMKKKMY